MRLDETFEQVYQQRLDHLEYQEIIHTNEGRYVPNTTSKGRYIFDLLIYWGDVPDYIKEE